MTENNKPAPDHLAKDLKDFSDIEMRIAQRQAWQAFMKDHPIAARKAKQRAEAEQRRNMQLNFVINSKGTKLEMR